MYYRNAQAALVVYDLTKPSSLVKARHWVAELQRQASPGIVIALVGNKKDLVEDEDAAGGPEGAKPDAPPSGEEIPEEDDGKIRKVSTAEAQSFAEEERLLFFETSAKSGTNVLEVFEKIAKSIPETALKGRGATPGAGQGGSVGAAGRGGGRDQGRVDLKKVGEQNGAKEGCAC